MVKFVLSVLLVNSCLQVLQTSNRIMGELCSGKLFPGVFMVVAGFSELSEILKFS